MSALNDYTKTSTIEIFTKFCYTYCQDQSNDFNLTTQVSSASISGLINSLNLFTGSREIAWVKKLMYVSLKPEYYLTEHHINPPQSAT